MKDREYHVAKHLLAVVVAMAIMAGGSGSFAKEALGEYIDSYHYLYGMDYTSWLERGDYEWWEHDNQRPADFNGELGYVTEDLDQDGEKELLTIGLLHTDEWDDYNEMYHDRIQLRVTVVEQDEGKKSEYVSDMGEVSNSLASPWDSDSNEQPICNLLRVYLYGKEPYIMIESYHCEAMRGDGSGITYVILKYTGEAFNLIGEHSYDGSDPLIFEENFVINLAKSGIGCVDFYSVFMGDGIIQAVKDYVPVAGLITRTIVNYQQFDLWRSNDSGEKLDVSVTHIFSKEELKKGVLKKLWDGDHSTSEGLKEWFEPVYRIAASEDSNIRLQPSLDGKIIGLLKKGEEIEYLDISTKDERGVDWYCVLIGKTYGWISSKYTVLVS